MFIQALVSCDVFLMTALMWPATGSWYLDIIMRYIPSTEIQISTNYVVVTYYLKACFCTSAKKLNNERSANTYSYNSLSRRKHHYGTKIFIWMYLYAYVLTIHECGIRLYNFTFFIVFLTTLRRVGRCVCVRNENKCTHRTVKWRTFCR